MAPQHQELFKARVRRNFDRAAATYDAAAKVQRWVCARLVSGLPASLMPAVILDAGCGTGFGMEILARRFPAARRIALDISHTMLSRVEHLEFGIVGDAERLPLKSGIAGLYWSNLTAQWCDPDLLAKEALRVLWPGGSIALSSLSPGTFHELEESFAEVDSHRHILALPSSDVLQQALALAGFCDIRLRVEPCVAHYRDLKSLLRAIKSIGANLISGERRQGLMGRGAWQKLEKSYESRRTPRGLPLTYQVILCYARK
ncbi:MAG: malonyl-ACP O-methyltransferase BioC [Zoogloeaceae bacterium]|jgi:malonyl-CoA O-methyltransferase|nr:malonyl-ACP O-methyltransferase BioC [Zoogloeaceae bacterium]